MQPYIESKHHGLPKTSRCTSDNATKVCETLRVVERAQAACHSPYRSFPNGSGHPVTCRHRDEQPECDGLAPQLTLHAQLAAFAEPGGAKLAPAWRLMARCRV